MMTVQNEQSPNCKRLRIQGIDSKESIKLVNVALQAGTSNRVVVHRLAESNPWIDSSAP
jgi:hypothetical protein